MGLEDVTQAIQSLAYSAGETSRTATRVAWAVQDLARQWAVAVERAEWLERENARLQTLLDATPAARREQEGEGA